MGLLRMFRSIIIIDCPFSITVFHIQVVLEIAFIYRDDHRIPVRALILHPKFAFYCDVLARVFPTESHFSLPASLQ